MICSNTQGMWKVAFMGNKLGYYWKENITTASIFLIPKQSSQCRSVSFITLQTSFSMEIIHRSWVVHQKSICTEIPTHNVMGVLHIQRYRSEVNPLSLICNTHIALLKEILLHDFLWTNLGSTNCVWCKSDVVSEIYFLNNIAFYTGSC